MSKPYGEGYHAGILEAGYNPYDAASAEGREWWAGYCRGRELMEALVEDARPKETDWFFLGVCIFLLLFVSLFIGVLVWTKISL